jgi:hypothetical protein
MNNKTIVNNVFIIFIIEYAVTRASRLELEIWSLKLPILPIKLYSFLISNPFFLTTLMNNSVY